MTAEHDPAPLAGLVALFTPGDTTEAYQDASSYLPARTQLTPLGAVESYNLGAHLARTYLAPGAPSLIAQFGTVGGRADASTVRVRAAAREDAFAGALAALQGLFPPSADSAITLANGTRVRAPLGGYRYVPVHTVERVKDPLMESWVECPTFEKHVAATRASPAFAQRAAASAPFFQHIQRFVPFPAGLADAWNVHEYVRAELVHNQTYAFRLEPTLAQQARHVASIEQTHLFAHADPLHIANVAGRTALGPVLDALERMAFDSTFEPKLVLEAGSYHHLLSFLSLLRAPDSAPDLLSLPDSASALLLELRVRPADGRAFVRAHLVNGTAPARPVHAFGHAGDIALTELLYRARKYAIRDEPTLATVCGRGRFRALPAGIAGVDWTAVALVAVFLLGALFARRRTRCTHCRMHPAEKA